MQERITIKRRPLVASKIEGGDHLHPLLTRVFQARGIHHANQLDYRLKNICLPQGLSGLQQAHELIYEALKSHTKIVVVGDFDSDGATATALVIRSMKAMGAKHIDFLVPNRFDYGYGLSSRLVEELSQQQTGLIITVDNGISSHAGVKLAKQLGMKVIITDHHLPSDQLPDADAIVNPNLSGDTFPSKNLAGVGVAFYLMASFKTFLDQSGWFDAIGLVAPNMSQWLDLVALGTVADVVSLDQNNRILVSAGLALMKKQKCVPGLLALFQIAQRDPLLAHVGDLGFALAPRLNAAGRLEDMRIGIELLLTDDHEKAILLADALNQINQQRQSIQQEMQIFADSVVNELRKRNNLPAGLCLYHKDWHQGVVGLLASRVKESTNRPTFAFAKESEHSGRLKGSGRSVDGFHIRDALVTIDQRYPDVIEKFGGHAMAAGLTLHIDKKKQFDDAFNEVVSEWAKEQGQSYVVHTDGSVDSEYLSVHVAQLIEESGPWGAYFPEPLFDDWFVIKQKKEVGTYHCKLQLQTIDKRKKIDAIAFQSTPNDFPEIGDKVQMTYHLQVNHFNGRSQLQLLVRNTIK